MTGKKREDILENTDLRTLWSDTLVEMLYDAIEYEWSNHALREIIKELRVKGYKMDQIINVIDKKFGSETAKKIHRTLKKP